MQKKQCYGCDKNPVMDVTTIFCRQFLNENVYIITFSLGFSVTGTTGKSVQEQIDKFSIIQSDSASGSPILHHIQNFIKT